MHRRDSRRTQICGSTRSISSQAVQLSKRQGFAQTVTASISRQMTLFWFLKKLCWWRLQRLGVWGQKTLLRRRKSAVRVTLIGYCEPFLKVLEVIMTILSILVINNHGLPRLTKFYDQKIAFSQREQIIRDCFTQVSKRSDTVCNFLEGNNVWGEGVKLIYRHYATLYFIFAVDAAESELGVLDLIQVFVEALDKCFENVCELDLIFHTDKVHFILDEIIMGGMVLETSLKEIIKAVDGSAKYSRASEALAAKKAPVHKITGKN